MWDTIIQGAPWKQWDTNWDERVFRERGAGLNGPRQRSISEDLKVAQRRASASRREI